MIPPFQAKLYVQLAINPIEKIGKKTSFRFLEKGIDYECSY